jgi:hypothetical protein
MSLQVNLSSPDITKAYQDVVNARGMDWLILTYEKASNDLRVQSTGNALEDLQEEFSDGRRVPLYSNFSLYTMLIALLQNSIRICSCDGPECGCRLDTSFYFRTNPYMIRAIFPSLCKSTGAEMVSPRRRRACFIHTPLLLPASSAERMSCSAHVMRSVTHSTYSTSPT